MNWKKLATPTCMNSSNPSCSKTFLYLVFILSFILTIQRQVFDFLGYMWLPILLNFLHLLFIIFGFFGLYQFKSPYILSYGLWSLFFLGWNSFIICFYLEVGSLTSEKDILSFGTGSYSWWLINGSGCKAIYDESHLHFPIRPSKVTDCVLNYQYVEVLEASLQILLCIMGLLTSLRLVYSIRLSKQKNDNKTSMYSIEYSPRVDKSEGDFRPQMTPRRVKRRSHGRSSSRSLNAKQSSVLIRNTRSTRSCHSHRSKNPVNRLIEKHNEDNHPLRDSSTSNDEAVRYGTTNQGFETSRPSSLYGTTIHSGDRPPSALTSYSNFHGQRKYSTASKTNNFLTQESLIQEGLPNDSSFDELPLPPPPSSSSPNLRMEYVNMPPPPPRSFRYSELNSVDNYGERSTLRADGKLFAEPQRVKVPEGRSSGAIPKIRSQTPESIDDKWYMHDSMRPVGASVHGNSCKCYRCQRKFTAI